MPKVKRKPKVKGKVRVKTYKRLKADLWAVFSEWTRKRFADHDGIVSCVTCGVRRRWNDGIDAGHFVSRSRLATFVHPENVAPQCKNCNRWGGNLASYAAWGVNRYGMDWPARMVALSKVPTKLSRADLIERIAEFEKKIELLGAAASVKMPCKSFFWARVLGSR